MAYGMIEILLFILALSYFVFASLCKFLVFSYCDNGLTGSSRIISRFVGCARYWSEH